MSAADDDDYVRLIGSKDNDEFTIYDQTLAKDSPPQYPSEWFARDGNAGKSPTIVISKTTDSLDYHVYSSLSQGNVDVIAAVRFLYNHLVKVECTLDSPWESFGVKIGDKGKVTIKNLVTFDPSEAVVEGIGAGGPFLSQKRIKGMIYAICFMHRLIATSNIDYRASLIDTMKSLLIPLECEFIDLYTLAANSSAWAQYKPFKQMMATLDMFMTEFPSCPYSGLRMGTIISRYRDCSVLMSTHALMNSLGLKITELARWIWTRNCAMDLIRVGKRKQEIENSRSYMPYFMDLGLSNKSPYSVSLNYNLHFFLHIIGSNSMIQRSINAVLVGTPELENVLTNANIMSYALLSFAKIELQFNKAGAIQRDLLDDSHGDERAECYEGGVPEPQSQQPYDWLSYLESHHNRVPAYIMRRITGVWARLGASRTDTIGAWLHQRVIEPENEGNC